MSRRQRFVGHFVYSGSSDICLNDTLLQLTGLFCLMNVFQDNPIF